MMKVICNSSPIIGLSVIGRLELLWKLFEVHIPYGVYDEIVNKSGKEAIGKCELKSAVESGYIQVYHIKDQDFINKYFGRLHRGELEVIVAARETGANIVIIDEKSARNFAEVFMLKPLGLLGILKLAKQKGIISEIKPLLDLLVLKKYRISNAMINQLLEDVGEYN